MGCEASPNHYGTPLNRRTRGRVSVVCAKPPRNIVEATITSVRRGPQGQKEQTMSHVFVLDTNKQPLDPLHPARARILLDKGVAAVFKRYPFTIILKTDREHRQPSDYRIKIDPGSKTTGIALVNDTSGRIVFAAEIEHRGEKIKASLDDKRAIRRSRRNRNTRYRKPRFLNRRNKKKAERKTNLDRRCSLKTEEGGTSPAGVKQEKKDAWTNAASRSDTEHDIDTIERSV